jgi:ferredoxin-NADP reductase
VIERQEIRPLEVMVAEVIRETHDAVTLVFFTGNDTLPYRAGHFLTIAPQQFPQLKGLTAYFEHVKGRKEPQRAYSMSSAPHERRLAVTVKEEPYIADQTPYPPLLSPFLVHGLEAGQRLTVVGFTGPYTLPDDIDAKTDHLVHVCAGSGIVPNFSILKHALHAGVKARQTVLYGNKTHDDIIFRDQLEALQRAHPHRVQIIHALSREPKAERHGSSYRTGRVDRALIEEFIGDAKTAVVFSCGPGITSFERKAARAKGQEPTPRFLESILGSLQAMEVSKDRINYESYG